MKKQQQQSNRVRSYRPLDFSKPIWSFFAFGSSLDSAFSKATLANTPDDAKFIRIIVLYVDPFISCNKHVCGCLMGYMMLTNHIACPYDNNIQL